MACLGSAQRLRGRPKALSTLNPLTFTQRRQEGSSVLGEQYNARRGLIYHRPREPSLSNQQAPAESRPPPSHETMRLLNARTKTLEEFFDDNPPIEISPRPGFAMPMSRLMGAATKH